MSPIGDDDGNPQAIINELVAEVEKFKEAFNEQIRIGDGLEAEVARLTHEVHDGDGTIAILKEKLANSKHQDEIDVAGLLLRVRALLDDLDLIKDKCGEKPVTAAPNCDLPDIKECKRVCMTTNNCPHFIGKAAPGDICECGHDEADHFDEPEPCCNQCNCGGFKAKEGDPSMFDDSAPHGESKWHAAPAGEKPTPQPPAHSLHPLVRDTIYPEPTAAAPNAPNVAEVPINCARDQPLGDGKAAAPQPKCPNTLVIPGTGFVKDDPPLDNGVWNTGNDVNAAPQPSPTLLQKALDDRDAHQERYYRLICIVCGSPSKPGTATDDGWVCETCKPKAAAPQPDAQERLREIRGVWMRYKDALCTWNEDYRNGRFWFNNPSMDQIWADAFTEAFVKLIDSLTSEQPAAALPPGHEFCGQIVSGFPVKPFCECQNEREGLVKKDDPVCECGHPLTFLYFVGKEEPIGSVCNKCGMMNVWGEFKAKGGSQ